MHTLRTRLRLDGAGSYDDAGLSMTEVITALFVFTIFILGLGYSLLSMTRLVGDDENREVAAALASQEMDRVRAIPDAFDVLSSTTTQQVGGVTFTITRTAGWVTTSGSTASCGSGGGNLQDKAVDVQVTWVKQYVKTSPIRATTVLAPSTRINDPNFSTIIVSTIGADGKGKGNVPVTVTNTATNAVLSGVDPTDGSGCSYVLKVAPGSYRVSLTQLNYISSMQALPPATPTQLTTPYKDITLLAGGSGQANFQFDAQATFNVTYGPTVSGQTPKLPTALSTTFLNTNGVQKVAASPSTQQMLFPFGEGYAAVAGAYTTTPSATAGCQSLDPVWWNAGTVGGVPLASGNPRPQTGVAPGATGALNVPMGVVAVTWPAVNIATSVQLQSAAAPAGTGDPGCFTAPTYTYNFSAAPAAGTTSYLAVPFGSYQAYSAVGSVLTLFVGGASATNATRGEVTGNVITLDPRIPS